MQALSGPRCRLTAIISVPALLCVPSQSWLQTSPEIQINRAGAVQIHAAALRRGWVHDGAAPQETGQFVSLDLRSTIYVQR
jgi:hypothetical protein